MRKARAAQQGQADGLCGLYCLVNFLRDDQWFRDGSSPQQRGAHAFRYLLEGAERERLLTPHHLAEGYEAHHLISIFSDTCKRLDLPYSAMSLRRFSVSEGSTDIRVLVNAVRKLRGAIVLSIDDKDHWVLSQRADDDVYIADSSRSDRTKVRASEIDETDGVVLLPVTTNA